MSQCCHHDGWRSLTFAGEESVSLITEAVYLCIFWSMSAYYALSHWWRLGDFNDPDPAPELQIPSCHVGRPLFRPWLAPRFRRWFQSAQFVHSTTQLLPGCCWLLASCLFMLLSLSAGGRWLAQAGCSHITHYITIRSFIFFFIKSYFINLKYKTITITITYDI